jgi:hypothetical protein
MANLTHSEAHKEPVDTTTFYKTTFLKAREDKQEAFIEALFSEDTDLCRRFLSYIRPPVGPLSISTDLDELSNEIAARVMDIDADDYLPEESDDADDDRYGHTVKAEQYDTDGLGKEVLRLIEPYGTKAIQMLEQGQLTDAARILLSIYEAQFLVEEPDLDDNTTFSYQAEIHNYFEQTSIEWMPKATAKTFKQADYDAILTLILARWKNFKRFHGKAESAPYEFLNADFFVFNIQNAKAEQSFLDFMTENKLHIAKHFPLTEKLCKALNKNDFLLEQLSAYGLQSAELSKALMQQYIDKKDRTQYIATAQKAYEKYGANVSEFIAETIEQTDNAGFFKRILSEVAAQKQRLDLYHRWHLHATIAEQEAYFDAQEKRNEPFFVALLHDAKRHEDLLEFAEEAIENFNSNAFEIAAKLLVKDYPDDIFSLYCERVTLFMNNGATSKNHYETAVSMLEPLKDIKGKTSEIKPFVEDLRKKHSRLPVFLDELTKKGF